MDKKEARQKLGMMLLKGSLAYTRHAKERMRKRKFTAHDVMKALSGGTMLDKIGPCKHGNGFECVMRTQLDDGRFIEVPIVADEDAGRIIIKSVVRKSK